MGGRCVYLDCTATGPGAASRAIEVFVKVEGFRAATVGGVWSASHTGLKGGKGCLRRLIVSCNALCENMLADMMALGSDGGSGIAMEALMFVSWKVQWNDAEVESRASNERRGFVNLDSTS